MPTQRPRLIVTESDFLARALDDAAKLWPEDAGSRAKLLVHLAAEGHRSVLGESARGTSVHRRAIDRTAGILTGTFAPAYRAQLAKEWPP